MSGAQTDGRDPVLQNLPDDVLQTGYDGKMSRNASLIFISMSVLFGAFSILEPEKWLGDAAWWMFLSFCASALYHSWKRHSLSGSCRSLAASFGFESGQEMVKKLLSVRSTDYVREQVLRKSLMVLT